MGVDRVLWGDEDRAAGMRGERVGDAAEQRRTHGAPAPLSADDQSCGKFVRRVQDGVDNALEGLLDDRSRPVAVFAGPLCAFIRDGPGKGLLLCVEVSAPRGAACWNAPDKASRVTIVSHTVSTTASTGRSISSAATLMAAREPGEPSKQNNTGPSEPSPVIACSSLSPGVRDSSEASLYQMGASLPAWTDTRRPRPNGPGHAHAPFGYREGVRRGSVT